MKKTDSWVGSMRQKLRPISLLLVIVLSTFSVALSPLFTHTASAVPPDDILNRARAWSILNAVIDKASFLPPNSSSADIDNCKILEGPGDIYVGSAVTGNNDNGGASWDNIEANSSILNGALASVGIQNGCRGLLDILGYQLTTTGMSKPPGLDQNTVRTRLQGVLIPNAFFGAVLGNDSPGDALAYALLIYNLKNVCGWAYRNAYIDNQGGNTIEAARNQEAMKNGATGLNRGQHYHTFTYENGKAGDVSTQGSTYYKDQGREDSVRVGSHSGFASSVNDSTVACGSNTSNSFGAILANNHKFAIAYAALVGTDGATDPGAGSTTPGDSATGEKTTCAIAAIGWIICPVMQAASKMVDGAYAIVSVLLEVQPLLSTNQGGQSTGIYEAWSAMRNFANVAFVIAFLVIVFSQLTSIGISNYGIKKMLPRLIVAAILVNASFWVCAIAVDLSNIVGGTLNGLLHNVAANNVSLNAPSFSTGQGGWQDITGKILAGTGITLVILYVELSALLPAIVAGLIIIVSIFIILTIRQALIILLIVISPLAFVAYLLPNTESLFKKWREMLQTLLMLYPIIALIFGASALASKILIAASGLTGG